MVIYAGRSLKKRIKKILLINPHGKIKITKEGSRERKLAVPSLGLGYLAAGLLRKGFDVEVLDILIEGFYNEQLADDTITYGLDDEAIGKRILDSKADMIGVSCIMSNRSKDVTRICNIAKKAIPDAHVAVGGQHPSGVPEMVLNDDIDYLLRGEADNSFIRLADTINEKGNLLEVDGIVLKEAGNIFFSDRQDYPDVKSLPYPAWELFDLEKYWEAGISDYEINESAFKKFMVMMTSRGCPHRCYFCTSAMMSGRKFRQREIDDVLSEIRIYEEKYHVDEIHFWDDNFFINSKRTKELLKQLINNFPGTQFQLPSGSEANKLDEEIIDLAAKAGFKKLFVAVESTNENIQNSLIDKKVNVDRIPYIVKKIQEAGIIAEGSFMVGFPGETKKQIDETFESVKSFGFDRISISIVNPLPGTPLYEQCKRENLLYDDFEVQDIRWSVENIKLEGVERGYIAQKRRDVWVEYMKDRIDIEKYEHERVRTLGK